MHQFIDLFVEGVDGGADGSVKNRRFQSRVCKGSSIFFIVAILIAEVLVKQFLIRTGRQRSIMDISLFRQ